MPSQATQLAELVDKAELDLLGEVDGSIYQTAGGRLNMGALHGKRHGDHFSFRNFESCG